MRAKKAKLFDWQAMDQGERLGYVWLLLFIVLVLATALTILVPAYKKWRAEEAGEEKKSHRRPLYERTLYSTTTPKEAPHGLVGNHLSAGKAGGLPRTTRLG